MLPLAWGIPMPNPTRLTTFAACTIMGLVTGGLSGCADTTKLGYYGTGYDARDVPGTPRTPIQIYRRLVEEGYELRNDPKQSGAVYFVDVIDSKKRPKCLILHAFSGTLLQSFAVGPKGFVAEIRHTPGPGFPGYPAVPDGRYASLCSALEPAADKDPLVRPGVNPDALRARF